MKCERVREVLYLISDDQLETEVARAFKDHVAACPHCAERASYTLRVLTVVRQRVVRITAPDGLRRRILDGFAHRRGLEGS